MKKLILLFAMAMFLSNAHAESLSNTLDVFVFPAQGQDSSQQSQDEVACYNWAVSNTGNDPFDLAKQSADDARKTAADKQAASKKGQGRGAGGAVKGAMVGALIGEIADDDAGEGAAYGAGIGMIAARRKAREERARAEAEAQRSGARRQAATAEQVENFKKAFSVCLEAKDYMVKY